jgi:amidohydrolase
LTADPVLAAAQVISALQGIVARNVPPLKSAVISVTSVQGGEAFNVIPSSVEIKGTIRSYDAEVRRLLLERLNEVISGVAAAMSCRAEIETWRVTPAVINDSQLTHRVQQVAGQLFPGDELDENERTMGSEDMAYVLEQIPAVTSSGRRIPREA